MRDPYKQTFELQHATLTSDDVGLGMEAEA